MKHRSRYGLALFLALWLPACDEGPAERGPAPSPWEWVKHESGFELAACYVPARDAVHCMVRNVTGETLRTPYACYWTFSSVIEERTGGEEDWTALREELPEAPAGCSPAAGLARPIMGLIVHEDVKPGEFLSGVDEWRPSERPFSLDIATSLREPLSLGPEGELLDDGFSLPLSGYAFPKEVDGPLELRVTSLVGGETKYVFPVVTRLRGDLSTEEAP